jgi:hypothetical protein
MLGSSCVAAQLAASQEGFSSMNLVSLSNIIPSLSLSLYLSIYLRLYSPLLGLGRFFTFLILHTVGRTPWTGDQPVSRPLPTQRTTQTQNKHSQTSMPRVGFEPTIPAFEQAKTVHALDGAATVIDRNITRIIKTLRMIWARYIECMVFMRNSIKV